MFLQGRWVEVAFVTSLEDALILVPIVLSLMNLDMLLQVRTRSKLFSANLALIGFLSSVNTLVPYQIRYLGEGLVATIVIAFERLFLVVNSGMLL